MTPQVDPPGQEIARRMWRALEPYHAITYFAPESKAAAESVGCQGWWMGYFGFRAAPLGAVSAPVVTATFYNFHPSRAERAVPDVWRLASPEQLLAARLAGVDEALQRMLGPDVLASADMAEAADLAVQAASAASIAGRPLAAANTAVESPARPHLALWQAQTLLRESRGDAHVAALLTADLDPCEAIVTFAAEGAVTAERLRTSRNWSLDEWAQASERLVRRGLLAEDGSLTTDGAQLRKWVEDKTDAASLAPWILLGRDRTERLADLVAPYVQAIVAGGSFIPGNPMGLRPLAGR